MFVLSHWLWSKCQMYPQSKNTVPTRQPACRRGKASAFASASSGMELRIPSSDSSHSSEQMPASVPGAAQNKGG